MSSVTVAILAGAGFGGVVVFFEQERETCPCAPQKKHLPSLLYHSLLASVTAFDKLALVSIVFDGPPRRGLNSPLLFLEKNGFFVLRLFPSSPYLHYVHDRTRFQTSFPFPVIFLSAL